MNGLYSQKFTLKDIFNNPKLKGLIPLVNYKEIDREDGKISRRTNMKTVSRLVYDTATSSARSYYKPLKASKNGNMIELSGNLIVDHNVAFNGVYKSLNSIKSLIFWTANAGDMIRDALKESEKNKKKYGNTSKLYLKVQSMQQIESMTKRQARWLLHEVLENILYGDDFPATQKKWNVENLPTRPSSNYQRNKENWKRKVGAE